MEYIDRIFYRKINPSDFKKLYDIDRPEGGGGQTYLEAAGISNSDIVDFLEYAEIMDSPLKDESRSIYTFNAYVLGDTSKSAFIEFAPRGGRNNYRISRQNIKYKHPAWSLENGFPEPNKDIDGKYTSEGNFEGIIDNLIIIILRTTYHKYYAGYVNSENMPSEWPSDIGLEKIFSEERRGVLNISDVKLEFRNSLLAPFGKNDPIERKNNGANVLLYGVPGSGKSWTIEHEYCKPDSVVERLVFHPDYTYSDFIGQILPAVADDGQVSYKFTPGPFTNILRESYQHPDKEYILIIEEINRGNAPAIFGEVFQLLDRKVEIHDINDDGYPIGTSEYGITNTNIAEEMYGKERKNEKIRIPSNLSIIGTMNTSDQNVFTLDTAFQRRWDMRLIENDFANVDPAFANAEILDTTVTWKNFCVEVNKIVVGNSARMTSAEDKRLGTYFVHLRDLNFDDNMGDLKEYDALRKKESMGNLTEDEKEQIAIIREAMKQNRKFPEKVIKYLWDDAFKFNREVIFETAEYQSLEQVIRAFMYAKGLERFNVFKDNVKDAFIGAEEE